MRLAFAAALAVIPTIASTAPAKPSFPLAYQWTWADSEEFCEAELTNGLVIRPSEIVYYDGPLRLIEITPMNTKTTARGVITTVLATLKEQGHYSSKPAETFHYRLTVVGNELYISLQSEPEEDQFKSENRSVRCPQRSYS